MQVFQTPHQRRTIPPILRIDRNRPHPAKSSAYVSAGTSPRW
jgi:hypothetical protein